MAGLTNNGTIVSFGAAGSVKVPTGSTIPTVVEVVSTAPEYKNKAFTIAKSTVEDATKSTTFDALLAAVTAAVTALLTADFDLATKTVVASADWKEVKDNQAFSDDFYNDTVQNYICTVDIFLTVA